jgi:hypothetical protein
MKELSGSIPLFLATNQVPVDEPLECHVPNWKIQHCQKYPIFSSERATRHPLIGKRFFEHARHESNRMLRIVVLQKYSTVTFIKKDQRSKPSLCQLDCRKSRSFLKRLSSEHQRIILEVCLKQQAKRNVQAQSICSVGLSDQAWFENGGLATTLF